MRREPELFDDGKKRNWGCLLVLALLILLVLAAAFLSTAMNAHPGKTHEKVLIPGLPKAAQGLKILHISDLHGRMFGENQQRLMKLLEDENYHAVCLTGDMLGKNGETAALLTLIRRLPHDVPVYLIPGDEDVPALSAKPRPDASPLSPWVLKAVEAGAVYLDAPAKLVFGKAVVWFCPDKLLSTDLEAAKNALEEKKQSLVNGADADDEANRAALRAVEYKLDVLNRTALAKQEMLSGDVYIALSHAPLGEQSLATIHTSLDGKVSMHNFPGRLSLILAGHLNDGQVRLPGVGALFVPASEWTGDGGFLPDSQKLSGAQFVRGVTEYITPGLGASRTYPWWARRRVMNTPRISLLTLIGDR